MHIIVIISGVSLTLINCWEMRNSLSEETNVPPPHVQWVKAPVPVRALTPNSYGAMSLNPLHGGHISFLGQIISRLFNKEHDWPVKQCI